AHLQDDGGIIDIGHDRQPAETGDNLAQKFESLGSQIGRLVRQAGDVAARARQTGDEAETVQLAPLIEEVIGTARQLAEQNKNRLIDAQETLSTITVDPSAGLLRRR